MTCLKQISPQHRGGLDAGDTDSVDLTPESHGPHRLNRKQITISDASESFKQLFQMLMPFSEYNENTITILSKAQNSSIQCRARISSKNLLVRRTSGFTKTLVRNEIHLSDARKSKKLKVYLMLRQLRCRLSSTVNIYIIYTCI